MARKSYWQSMWVGDDTARKAVKMLFMPLCEGMTPYQADVLCDIATDAEKKIRAFMTDEHGAKFKFERTRGHSFSITKKPIAA